MASRISLTLAPLNEATQAWVEYDYNRKRHSEIDDTLLARFLAGPDVTRPCPDAAALRLAITRTEWRSLAKSDGTVTIEGRGGIAEADAITVRTVAQPLASQEAKATIEGYLARLAAR
jgi:hypothetical protein